MNKIIKTGLFGGFARAAFIDVTDMVNEEIKIHSLSPLATAALGRSLTMGAYVCANLKSPSDTFSITVNGGGPLGSIVIAGGDHALRGYVDNASVDLPLRADGHLDVGGGVGKDGFITVIKDLGLKEPYVGRCELVSGEIAEDFAKYLLVSEGIKNTAAFGVKVDKNGCIAAGGVVVEALPGITEDMLFILEDVMTNFSNVSDLVAEKGIKGIYDFYFSHLDAELYAEEDLTLRCNCSQEKIDSMIKGIGKQECEEILAERGSIEAVCHFCEKKYVYGKEELDKLWEK